MVLFQPSVEGEKRAGTVYLKSDLRSFYERLRLYAGIAGSVLVGSMLVALGISTALQRRITDPIQALVNTAKVVSQRGDYSVRAHKTTDDELGTLTDAFNAMLTEIQERDAALAAVQAKVEDGWQQSQRRETRDGPTFMKQMRARLAKKLHSRST